MYQVGEFEFESLEMAQKAQKEYEGIRYMREKTRMDDPEVVLKLYNKLILKDIFATPLGFQFLSELRTYLLGSGSFRPEQVHRIPVPQGSLGDSASDKKDLIRQNRQLAEVNRQLAEARRLNKNKRDYKRLLKGSLIFSAICVLVIGGLLFLMATGDNNMNIINYENKILNKYEAWEEELDQREQALSRREEELGIAPVTEAEEGL